MLRFVLRYAINKVNIKEKGMPRYIIIWDAGYGEMADDIEAKNHEEAVKCAYEAWQESAESQAEYRAEEYTEDLAEDYGL